MPNHRPLNQVIAILKGVKSRVMARSNEIHHQLQSTDALSGQARTYVPKVDGDMVYPAENKKVQVLAHDHLKELAGLTTELFDTEACLDYANCTARANVVVDGAILVENAPATFLIFLEKQLTDLHTTLAKCGVPDPAKEWVYDSGARIFRAARSETVKTKKVERPLVLAPAIPGTNGSPGLPAQVKTTIEDINEGVWTTIAHSGAVSTADKKVYLDRIQHVIDAVKVAREQANMADAQPVTVGKRIMDFIGI